MLPVAALLGASLGASAPANDAWASAMRVTYPLEYAYTGTTTGAGVESAEPLPCGEMGATVWFRYTAAASGAATANTFTSGFDTVLAVWDRDPWSHNAAALTCNDDAGGDQSLVLFNVVAGKTYWLQAGGYLGATGSLVLRVDCGSPLCRGSVSGADSDGDGCGDVAEVGDVPELGGDRDPSDAWDFYDITGDRGIDFVDTLLIVGLFGTETGDAAYDASLDRYAPDDLRPWRSAASATGIDLEDALTSLASFGHGCG